MILSLCLRSSTTPHSLIAFLHDSLLLSSFFCYSSVFILNFSYSLTLFPLNFFPVHYPLIWRISHLLLLIPFPVPLLNFNFLSWYLSSLRPPTSPYVFPRISPSLTSNFTVIIFLISFLFVLFSYSLFPSCIPFPIRSSFNISSFLFFSVASAERS